jgi:hypothetical protein
VSLKSEKAVGPNFLLSKRSRFGHTKIRISTLISKNGNLLTVIKFQEKVMAKEPILGVYFQKKVIRQTTFLGAFYY